jgi:tRNA U34 2-thiouridine synthase MnmA/TrmU
MAKIRYNHTGAPAMVEPLPDGTARVRLHAPARAVTPGQACVFYDGDRVLGGGWIRREPRTQEAADQPVHQASHQAGTERTR